MDTTFEDMVGQVEKGIYMQSNNSWSIDDSRNKFQFGCEIGQIIKDGKLAGYVKHPGYRGVSSEFLAKSRCCGEYGREPSVHLTVGKASPTK